MKRIFGFIVMAMLLAALFAAPAMAVDTEAELTAAFASGGNISLTGNITCVATGDAGDFFTIASGKTVTLDLAGFTLSGSSATGFVIANSGTLTINDSSSAKTGAITNTNDAIMTGTGSVAKGAVRNGSGAVLTVNGGTLTSTNSFHGDYDVTPAKHNPSYGIDNRMGTVNLFGGKVQALYAVRNYAYEANSTATLTVDGAELLGYANAIAVQPDSDYTSDRVTKVTVRQSAGKTTVVKSTSGPAIHNDCSAGGELTITGGTIQGTRASSHLGVVNVADGKFIMSGGDISVIQNTSRGNEGTTTALWLDTYSPGATASISGGTITNIYGDAAGNKVAIEQNTQRENCVTRISGGVFTGVISADASVADIEATGGTYSSNPKDYVSSGYAVAYRDNMYVVEKPAPVPTEPDLPTDKPADVVPVTPTVTSVDIEADDTAKAEAVETAIGDVKDGTITAADLEVSPQGVVVPKETVVKAAALDALKDSAKTVTVEEIVVLPVFAATLESADNVAAIGYPLKGSDLKAAKAGDVKVLKILSAGSGALFSFEGDPASTGDKEYALQVSGDKAYLAADAAIEAGKDYTLLLFIKDNGDFDLCSAEKKIVDPAAIVKTKEEGKSSGGGSGGCNAGFVGMLLLAVVPFVVRRKK